MNHKVSLTNRAPNQGEIRTKGRSEPKGDLNQGELRTKGNSERRGAPNQWELRPMGAPNQGELRTKRASNFLRYTRHTKNKIETNMICLENSCVVCELNFAYYFSKMKMFNKKSCVKKLINGEKFYKNDKVHEFTEYPNLLKILHFISVFQQ